MMEIQLKEFQVSFYEITFFCEIAWLNNFLFHSTAHKTILALKSEYFRAMFYGGLSESNTDEITLENTPVEAFKAILKYIYTGRIYLQSLKVEQILEIIDLSNQYGFDKLKKELPKYLEPLITIENATIVLNASFIYEIDSLTHSKLSLLR
jgi:BTB/POZ domain-containing protein 9